MVYKSLHGLAAEYLCSRLTTKELAYNRRDSEDKLCVHCHAQIIAKIALATVALFFGIVSVEM